jgi:hypothetical protein
MSLALTEPQETVLTDWVCLRCWTTTPGGRPDPYKNCCRWPFVIRLTAVEQVPVNEEASS